MSDRTEIPPPPRPAEYEGVDRSTGTVLVVVGVALVLLGLVLLANPFAAIWILGVLIGVSLVIGGLAEVAAAKGAPGPRWPSLLIGGVVMIAGVAAAVWPDATVWVLAVVAGLGLAITGAVTLVGAVVGGPDGRGLRLVLGGVSLVIGLAVLAWPDATLLVIALLVGFRTLVNGVVSIGIGLNIRRYAA